MMTKRYKYNAFGLVIESEFPIIQVLPDDSGRAADVVIRRNDLPREDIGTDRFVMEKNTICFQASDAGWFRITDGKLIEADPIANCTDNLLAVYLMGSCMGAVIHQRGLMPVHGSCVTDGKHSVLITGDSGAGKSTLAAEFLAHGWKLLTDDVAIIKEVEGRPVVQSSYPSQKLWEDALARYDQKEDHIRSLYTCEDREKYGVARAEKFFAGTAELTAFVRLIPDDADCCIENVEGMTRADQLMRNTYRPYMIAKENRPRHFQRCVTLAQKTPMFAVIRKKGEQNAGRLYEMIIEKLK